MKFLIFSCKSFLEEAPVDRYVLENFFNDQNDAIGAVNAVYSCLYNTNAREMVLLNEFLADDQKNGRGMPNVNLIDIEYLRFNSQNQFVSQMWQATYQGIARANAAIENIPNVKIDDVLKNRLIAEARFLRGHWYFNLVRFYGDVPLITSLVSSKDAKIQRTPQNQVYEQIIDDLNYAENNLPVKYSSIETGRATRGAAKILLGKVYLTMHDYAHCVDKLSEVIENEIDYGYGLHDDYGDNWNADTENGKEMVFSIEYMAPTGKGNLMMQRQGPTYSIKGGHKILGIANLQEADIPTMDLYNQFVDQDERKNKTFRKEFISLIDGSIHVSDIVCFVKYWQENLKTQSHCGTNVHILRYADALLMYAEALNELGKTSEALNYLNRIRERAFNSTDYNYSGLSQDEFRTSLLHERRLEFAMEGHRWFDLVRTGKFIKRMKEHSTYEASVAESNKIEIGQNIKDHMILLPIPQRELDINPELTQNPGW